MIGYQDLNGLWLRLDLCRNLGTPNTKKEYPKEQPNSRLNNHQTSGETRGRENLTN
jgi:hypothetical protein